MFNTVVYENIYKINLFSVNFTGQFVSILCNFISVSSSIVNNGIP